MRIETVAAALTSATLVACGGPAPELISINVSDPNAPVSPGVQLTITVSARNVHGLPIVITSYLESPLSGHPRALDEQELVIEQDTDPVRGNVLWRPPAEAFEIDGTSELSFTAGIEGQVVASEPRFIKGLDPKLDSLSVRYASPFRSLRVVTVADPLPSDAEVELTLVSQLIAGRRSVSVDVLLGDETTPVETFPLDVTSNSHVFVRRLQPVWLGADDTKEVHFVANAAGLSVRQTVLSSRRGVHRCAFHGMDGSLLSNEQRINAGTPVEFRLYGWGVDGVTIDFQLWEQDSVDDDAGPTFQAVGAAGVATVNWTAEFTDDGALDTVAEWYFRASASGITCKSEQFIEVPE